MVRGDYRVRFRSRGYVRCGDPVREVALLSFALLSACGIVNVDTDRAIAIDGDTISLGYGKPHIRLARIDAPEMPGHPCPVSRRPSCVDNDPAWARDSQAALQRLLDTGPGLTCYREDVDVYGRWIAECNTGHGTNINDIMLASGMAQPYRR